MGTSLVMELVSGVVCIGTIYLFVSATNRGETETIIVCMLYSASLMFRVTELMHCWFQSKLKSKYPSVVSLGAYIVVSAYKIFLLATGKNIYWFSIVNSIEYGVVGVSLILIYRRLCAQKFGFSVKTAKKLLSRSKYYILASMMATVFQNTDHIMLKIMSGDAQNGFYSAAITCASVCQFFYTAITDSARPVILTSKKQMSADYERNISRLYAITTYMALIQGVGFTIFAGMIVRILYGEAYLAAIPVLRIQVWMIAFSFMGSVRNIWILAEGKQNLIWKINLAGALLNVLLNGLMIPRFGASGASAASLITQIFTNFLLGFLIPSMRDNNRLLIKGLNPVLLLDWIPWIHRET